MSAINPELFNETYHFETSVFEDPESPDKKVQINQEIEFTITWNRETRELSLSDLSLEHSDYRMIFSQLYGQNGRIPKEDRTPFKLLNIIGTDKETHKIIQIEASADSWTIDGVKSIKITDENVNSISEHKDHYLYQNPELSKTLHSSSIAIEGIDYPFTICNENIGDTPHNLNCISLVYSLHKGGSPPPKNIQDYHEQIIGFLFGGPLTNFGYLRYDVSGKVIETYVITPSHQTILMSLNAICPPIDYDNLSTSRIQKIFNEIVVNYRTLPLEIYYPGIVALLHRLWGSHLVYLDYKLILIVSGLEIFMKIWSGRYNLNFGQKDIISKDDFKTLTSKEIKNIKDNIARCNQISEGERHKLYTNIWELNKDKKKIKLSEMYTHIGMTLTDNEIEIIILRDRMIHDTALIPEGQESIHADVTLDAITLCNRSLLTLLGKPDLAVNYREKWR